LSFEKDERKSSKSDTSRRAAYKAWRTIRSKQRDRAAKGSSKLERFVEPPRVTKIEHPETSIFFHYSLEEENEISFGKGIISKFHKTPPDISCGNFWELKWAFGCPLDCNYCYLRGTMRGNMKPRIIKLEYVLAAIDQAFSGIKTASIFNSGELSDSLMNPSIMVQLADKFESQSKHKLSILSKFGPKNVRPFLSKPRKQTICAWSINAIEVARKWERAAATPEMRIEAAKLMSEAGYDTRVRLDPIFPIEGWKTHYEDIIYTIFDAFEPKRMILGTPRGLWKTITYAQKAGLDMKWASYFKEDSSWGKKIGYRQRLEIYEFFYDKLQSLGYGPDRVSLCKETVQIWKDLGLAYVQGTCNCYGSRAYS
jgi:spore photoproduct lyase